MRKTHWERGVSLSSDLGSSSTVDQGFQALAYVGLPPQPAEQLFPVSMLMDPPFTMMVHLTGRGDDQVSCFPPTDTTAGK